MTLISVVIPTVPGREESLARAVRGYVDRTLFDLELIVIRDSPSCGIGWQRGADLFQGDYLHFSADDVVPGFGWAGPMIEACEQGAIAATLSLSAVPEVLDEAGLPLPDNPVPTYGDRGGAFFYERQPSGPGAIADWERGNFLALPSATFTAAPFFDYASAPFCSREQWQQIGPMIPTTYATDKWFSWRAWNAGIPVVARHGPVFYHYSAQAGKGSWEDGWLHTDQIDFDMNIAFPLYISGELDPREPHPDRMTPKGRQLARAWRSQHVSPPHPWDLEPDPQFK